MQRSFKYLLNPEKSQNNAFGDPNSDTEIFQFPEQPGWYFYIRRAHSTAVGITANVDGGRFSTRKAALKEASRIFMAIFGQVRVVKCKDHI